jgi:Tfp pilus assembly PilM family ATPase
MNALPLGIDFGSSRIRLAFSERRRDGMVCLKAVVSRDVPHGVVMGEGTDSAEYLATLLEEMMSELGSRERRCVFALGFPHAAVRVSRFPKMTWFERKRAARFEAERFTPWKLDPGAIVRVHPVARSLGLTAIGVARREALLARTTVLRSCKLRPVAADYDALALGRAFPNADAVLDIGAERTSLHVRAGGDVSSWSVPFGGSAVTSGIARELSLDVATAEKRKRILGSAGAGFGAREELISQIGALVDHARQRSPIARIAVTGNGARLPGLVSDLQALGHGIVEMPVSEMLDTSSYPDDVLRAASPDWSLAAALSMWGYTP